MNPNNTLMANPKIWKVIEVIENHFDKLCGLGESNKLVGANGKVPFTCGLPKPATSNNRGLLRLAMVGSAERTLQGEVFYAIRTNEIKLGGSAILEMKVSEWHYNHRNIDCVISPDAPNSLDASIFIELGHYSTIQSAPKKIVLNKIKMDFSSSSLLIASKLGPILHIMFVTHIDQFIPQKTSSTNTVRDWPRLPGYFVDGWTTSGPLKSHLASSGYKNGKVHKLADIDAYLLANLKPYYIGHVQGCAETVDLGNGVLKATGRVDRFYSVHP